MIKLEFFRRKQRLSQEALAMRILYSRYVISRLESERPATADVNLRLQRALESYFNVSFHELMEPVSDFSHWPQSQLTKEN